MDGSNHDNGDARRNHNLLFRMLRWILVTLQWILQSLFAALLSLVGSPKNDDFKRSGEIRFLKEDGSEYKQSVVFQFDTASNVNLIKQSVLQDVGVSALVEKVKRIPIRGPDGGVLRFRGQVNIRWWAKDKDVQHPKIFPPPGYIRSEFYVVPDCPYDVIIGLDTMDQESLQIRSLISCPTHIGGLYPKTPVRTEVRNGVDSKLDQQKRKRDEEALLRAREESKTKEQVNSGT